MWQGTSGDWSSMGLYLWHMYRKTQQLQTPCVCVHAKEMIRDKVINRPEMSLLIGQHFMGHLVEFVFLHKKINRDMSGGGCLLQHSSWQLSGRKPANRDTGQKVLGFRLKHRPGVKISYVWNELFYKQMQTDYGSLGHKAVNKNGLPTGRACSNPVRAFQRHSRMVNAWVAWPRAWLMMCAVNFYHLFCQVKTTLWKAKQTEKLIKSERWDIVGYGRNPNPSNRIG